MTARTGLLVLAWSLPAAGQDVAGVELPQFRPINAEIGLRYPMPDAPRVGLVDFNGDGYVDVVLDGQFWRNDGRGRFEIWSRVPGPYVSFGDFDNDGDLDIYATSFTIRDKAVESGRWLLRYDRDGQYTDVTKESGLEDAPPSKAHGFLDYDNDGYLDLFVVGHYRLPRRGRAQPLPDRLYRGDGTGRFTDVTEAAGLLAVEPRRGAALVLCDFDNDGFVDIYVANYDGPNFLWHNQGDGTFREIAEAVGAAVGRSRSVGVVCVDYDNDGDFDLFVTNLSQPTDKDPQPRSMLLRNEFVPTGELRFTDVTAEVGLDWEPPPRYKPHSAWRSPVFADFNNDGWLDLFVSESCQGGAIHRHAPLKYGPFDAGYSKLYLNQGGQRFVRIDTERNFLRVEDSWGAAAADVDGDGWLDLLVGSNTWVESPGDQWFDPKAQRSVFLRGIGLAGRTGQPPDQAHQYLTVVVTARDRAVTGAVVELTLDDGHQRRAVVDMSMGGYTVKSNQLHFGLGARSVTEIRVILPGGASVEFPGSWRNVSLLVDASKEARAEPRVLEPWR